QGPRKLPGGAGPGRTPRCCTHWHGTHLSSSAALGRTARSVRTSRRVHGGSEAEIAVVVSARQVVRGRVEIATSGNRGARGGPLARRGTCRRASRTRGLEATIG